MRHAWKAKDHPCRVYWGTHGCRKQRGHLGNHRCLAGCPFPEDPYYPYTLFGEDVPGYELPNGAIPIIRRIEHE
jgi:hypothetical protein